jgi:rubrerythrin
MKKLIYFLLVILAGTGLRAVAGSTDQTVADLKNAFKGESTASAKYAAYAEQAKKEGYTEIATMFAATSKAEAMHAANHKKVIEKMGQSVDPVKPEFSVKSTKENLADASAGENEEMTKMYPGYIATAKAAGATDAAKSMRWAMETEKKHYIMYQNALTALNAGKEKSLPKIYWVCLKCGNTYDVAKPESTCSFCSTASSKFMKFGK